MHEDDEILDAYEAEFDQAPNGRRSRRGFLLVTGSLLVACIVMLVAIFANRPLADQIGTAQHDLRLAQAGAERVYQETGTYAGASAEALTEQGYDGGELTYVGAEQASVRLGEVSVTTDGRVWAAAIQVRSGACFYLKLESGRDDPLYGVGTDCTATQALASSDDRW